MIKAAQRWLDEGARLGASNRSAGRINLNATQAELVRPDSHYGIRSSA
jgi:hypothetical protein